MKKFRCIAVTSPSFSKHKILVSETAELANRMIINDSNVKWTEDSIVDWLNTNEVDAVIVGTDPFHRDVIAKLKHVKAVGKYGVGCDNVDIPELASRGIFFGWEGGVNRRSVTELALTFMLGHSRNIFRTMDKMQQGHWDKNGGSQLSDKKVGIVGLGYIGTDLARLLKALGSTVFYCDVVDKSKVATELGISSMPYEEMVKTVDIISFHVPGGKLTHHMFGVAQIKQANPKLLVVNTARGHVVEFNATVSAVKEGRLGGYASDVFPEEPLHSKDFAVSSGFYFTPHIGGNAEEAVLAMGRSAIKGLRDYLTR